MNRAAEKILTNRARRAALLLLAALAATDLLRAATLTVSPQITGTTPQDVGYNAAHFMPGSNAADWWRYSGVNAARFFVTPTTIEPALTSPATDGVATFAQFVGRRAALRANAANPSQPLDSQFIDWPALLDRYENATFTGVNRYRVNHAFRALRAQGVHLLANINGSLANFPIAGESDWGGRWNLWRHYYAQAFYLGREFGVRRFIMFDEPNLPGGGMPFADWHERLRLVADALQAAHADLHARYGIALATELMAPVTISATGSSLADWGVPAVQRRHETIDGSFLPEWLNFQTYSYQYFGTTASFYFNQATTVRNTIAENMPGEVPFPVANTGFNVGTGAALDASTLTLDDAEHYARLGAILVRLTEAAVRHLYLYKFGQTVREGGNYPVMKNGTHYCDNATSSATNNYGGITQAGEVYRLFARAAAGARPRLQLVHDAGPEFHALATFDAEAGEFRLFLVNDDSAPVSLQFDLTALGIPHANRAFIEEVSEKVRGAIALTAPINTGVIAARQMPAKSVWLVSIPLAGREPLGGANSLLVAGLDAVTLADGAARLQTGATNSLQVRSDGTIAGRRVTLVRVPRPPGDVRSWQRVMLSLHVRTLGAGAAQAHVYGLADSNWSSATASWATLAPALRQFVPAGNQIAHNIVANHADAARIVGQLAADSTTPAEALIDITAFARAHASSETLSFLIAQDHRWDVDVRFLPTVTGDTQPTGLAITSFAEAASGNHAPRLRVVRALTAPAITLSPVAQTVQAGDTVMLQAAAVGLPEPALQWFRDGQPVAGATGATLTLFDVPASAAGSYHVTATNSVGAADSAAALLRVEVPDLRSYAFGPGEPRLSIEGGQFVLRFFRRRADVDYVVQTSTDLSVWGDYAANPGEIGAEAAVPHLLAGESQRFFRVRLSLR